MIKKKSFRPACDPDLRLVGAGCADFTESRHWPVATRRGLVADFGRGDHLGEGALIARFSLSHILSHPFIRRVLRYFIAFTPVAVVLIVFFGDIFARWASLVVRRCFFWNNISMVVV